MFEIKFCPYCGCEELIFVGIGGDGSIYKCSRCHHIFVIKEA